MSTSIVSEFPPISNPPPVVLRTNADYEVSADGAVEHKGRLLRGVFLNGDGAWAGQLRDDGHGAWVDLAFDAYGDFVPASPAWDAYIVREVPPIGSVPASPSPEGGAYPVAAPCRIGDVPRLLDDDAADLAIWAATMFPRGVCACGRPIAYGATACLDCDPDQYESDRLFDLYPGTLVAA